MGKGTVIAFAGVTPNVGTTLAAFAAAVRLAMSPAGIQVGYLCLNLKSSKLHHYLRHEPLYATLDAVRSQLGPGGLTGTSLANTCRKLEVGNRKTLHVLYGSMLREQAEYYTPSQINHLLDCAAGVFDYCIVDVSAYWDNAATIIAMRRANFRYLVASNRLGSFQEDVRRWIDGVAELFVDSSRAPYRLMVSEARPGGVTNRIIQEETRISVSGRIPYDVIAGDALDQGKLLWLCQSGWPRLISAIDGMLQDVVPNAERYLSSEKGTWIRSRLWPGSRREGEFRSEVQG